MKQKKLELTAEAQADFDRTGSTGWVYADAVMLVDCPKCGAEKGCYCQSAKGHKVDPPHSARVRALRIDDPSVYEVKIVTGAQLLQSLKGK